MQSVHSNMKKEIHPQYFKTATITCACGEVYHIGSTKENIQVELCAACHPFYTGKQKILDTARRVEKFQERLSKQSGTKTGKTVKRAKRAKNKASSETAEPSTDTTSPKETGA